VYRLRNGGNMWTSWVGFLSFFRHVVGLSLDYTKWDHYEVAALAGPRYMHKRFTIVSDRPEWIRMDERNRPHCENGPSHRWRDGIELFFWRGTRIPAAWSDRKNITPEVALTWPNIELRRCAMEMVGWNAILAMVPHRTVDKDPEPEIGELIEAELPDAGKAMFLRVLCGTGREFALSVPLEMTTALEANAWTYDLKPTQYKLEVRT